MGKKIVIGHLRVGYWHYQKIGAEVREGQDFPIAWKYPYERDVKGSPFRKGEAWWPMYPGKWRLVSRIAGKCRTTPVIVTKDAVGRKDLAYKPPASGPLEWVFIYLYDRTPDTPQDVYTPMDICREAILGEARP
jgi:hypothetical protein